MHPADQLDVVALRELAVDLARRGGDIALAGRRAAGGAGDLGGSTKSSRTDVVTEFDRATEAAIVATIRELRPGDGIVGEEGAALDSTNGVWWFIDPIDGTTNFVYDLPAWSCSVAVAQHRDGHDEMLAGAVFAPALGEMFAAALGHGATLNGRPIRAARETDLSLALVATGFSYRADAREAQVDELRALIGRVRDIRRFGSAAIDLCFVAAGRLDAYYERHLNSWDAAAGELIAREAGATTSDFAGGPPRPAELLAAAPGIHDAVVAALAGAT